MPGKKNSRHRKKGNNKGRQNAARASNQDESNNSKVKSQQPRGRDHKRNSQNQPVNKNPSEVKPQSTRSKHETINKDSGKQISDEENINSVNATVIKTPGILNRPPFLKETKHDWDLFEISLGLFHHYLQGANKVSASHCSSDDSDDSVKNHSSSKPILSRVKYSKSFLPNNQRKKRHVYCSGKNEATPPNDYSSLSIFPSRQDIKDGLPFLRSNIVQGEYENCEHYLDVQFRLFREDYISPLRDGIKEYKEKIAEHKEKFLELYDLNDIKKKLKLIYIYEEVRITNPELDNMFGIIHTLNFKQLPSTFIWKGNSRLQEGTLLCLSLDEFEDSFIFATVVYRFDDDVATGKIKVCFEEQQHDILYDIPASAEYTMLEMRSGYFEAYRHTLSVLKEFKEDNFPLKNYIVKAERNVESPCYLNENTVYDFSPILKKESFQDEEIPVSLKEVPILELEKWPSREELGLDFTQYCVLKAALTKEFCIIQGPPGTGKTFMGLKIVKMLLHNNSIWYPKYIEQHECPILIVCYTNHALDQFLEKILEFTDSVVRIGDQGESELLESFKLKNLRSLHYPCNFSTTRKRLEKKQNAIKDQINTYNFVMEATSYVILKPKILRKYMKENHYRSLMSCYMPEIRSVLEIWLQVSYHKDIKDFNTGIGSTLESLNINEKDMDIEEICSWIKWEPSYDKEQTAYGWNKPASKGYKEYIKRNMCEINMMTADEAATVENIWDLELPDRWRLYRFWIAQFIIFIVNTVKSLQQEFIDITKQMKEIRWEKDLAIVQHCKIVGMTCTGTAKFHYLIETLAPQIVIIEEAAEVLEPHLISSLPKSTKHLILIGDHQQLRPLPAVHELAVHCKLDVSLFERMVKNQVEYSTLVSQHRMRPCIADLLIDSIYNKLTHHESVYHYDDILGVEKNMYFISHINQETKLDNSYYNLFEAKMVVRLTRYLLLQGYEPSQITVLATYSCQIKMIRDERKKILEENKNITLKLDDIKVTTVDNYQGEENDIVIVSFVRSNYEGNIGFLKAPNRVCVALSRARMGLYCIGNFEFLASESELWKCIVTKLNEEDALGSSLTLVCQNHLFKTSIEFSSDFKNVFDGGCTEICGVTLKCGHTCKRFCHFTDTEHKQYKCEEKCTKQCKNEHPCERKCHEDCGKCTKHRFAKLPCGHRLPVPCYVDDLSVYQCKASCDKMMECGHICTKLCYENCKPCMRKIPKTLPCKHTVVVECSALYVICTQQCSRILPCGHQCPNKCGEICAETCKHNVAINLPCNHITTIACNKRNGKIVCEAACNTVLSCGHKCPGNCTRCQQGTKHVECWHTCGKIVHGRGTCKLRCGHTADCSMNASSNKRFLSDFGKPDSGLQYCAKHPYGDTHMVNKWKTGYDDEWN